MQNPVLNTLDKFADILQNHAASIKELQKPHTAFAEETVSVLKAVQQVVEMQQTTNEVHMGTIELLGNQVRDQKELLSDQQKQIDLLQETVAAHNVTFEITATRFDTIDKQFDLNKHVVGTIKVVIERLCSKLGFKLTW